MKVCIIQPPYSTDYSQSDIYFQKELELLNQCDESMDLIVLPESCDIPCLARSKEDSDTSFKKYNKTLLDEVSKTAKRCNALVFVNARSTVDGKLRNTTYAFNRQGEIVGKYYKEHLTPGEISETKLDCEYGFEFSEPTVIEIEGLRFGFLICYDFYFYEYFSNIARQNVDIIIGCSHQRSDTHRALEIMSQFLAYNTNAYVIRSSVSMDESSDIGGGSMVVSPTGEILANMYSKVGLETVDINPKDKYYKPAGFGNPLAAHYEYIEKGRRPWKYRPAGSAIVRHDEIMQYPRVCSLYGFNTVAPKNSMAAFGSALALGAKEIAFELWFTKDGEPVSIHDPNLENVSNGTGKVWEYTLAELKELDFGYNSSDKFKGIKIPTFEEILKKFSCHCVMNIGIDSIKGNLEYIDKIISLIKKYDCEKYVYFTTKEDNLLDRLQKEYPKFTRCCSGEGNKLEIIERAIKFGCRKVQFANGCFNQETVNKAKELNIITGVCFSDCPAETENFLNMGIDVILTNDYNRIAQVVEQYKNRR